MRWLEFLLSSTIEIWVLIGALVWVTVITLSTLKKIETAKSGIPSFAMKMRTLLKKGSLDAALGFCNEDQSAISNVVKRGLKKYKFGRARIVEEAGSAGQVETKKLEESLTTLATISNAAPLVGFLGTILSLGSLFSMLQYPQSDVTFGSFSRHIGNALISSGLGLFVGIAAMVLYNYLVTKINKVGMDMERFASEIFDLIENTEHEAAVEENVEV